MINKRMSNVPHGVQHANIHPQVVVIDSYIDMDC